MQEIFDQVYTDLCARRGDLETKLQKAQKEVDIIYQLKHEIDLKISGLDACIPELRDAYIKKMKADAEAQGKGCV